MSGSITGRAMRAALLLAAGLSLAGCASSPAPMWHSLVPASDPRAAAAPVAPVAAGTPARAPLTLLVAALGLPDEVDRPQLVLRSADGALAVLDNERWAEPLKAQLPRAIALSLAQRLPGMVVGAAPNSALVLPDWRVAIDVQRFELQRGAPDRAVLRVLWSLRAASAGDAAPTPAPAVQLFEVSVPASSASPAALAAAMSVAIEQLCGQMSRALTPRPLPQAGEGAHPTR